MNASSNDDLPAESSDELYEHAPCGYLTTKPNGTIARVNKTFLEWSGHERDELLSGAKFADLLSVGGKIFYETHFAPLLTIQGYVNEIAFDLTCKGGRLLPVLVNALQKKDGAGRAVLNRITIFNATDRRRYEQQLLEARRAAEKAAAEVQKLNETLERRVADEVIHRMKAEESLRQAQKMEAIGQLTGGVAHDFNNLLTIVLGNTETVLRHLPEDSARLRRAATHALQGAQRAATLTKRLLAFARQQPLDPKPIDVNGLLGGLSEMLTRTLGETISIESVVGAGLWRTHADPNQLENAILNLAVNARDAMPNGGRLTIETANAHLDSTYVSGVTEPLPAGQYVQVSVTDTGTGMGPETLSKVFEPFFTTKEAGKGTGLGLSQVYGFVRQSGGHVRIYSEVGEGTTVKIYLPRHTSEEFICEAEPSHPITYRGEGETILIVEDDAQLRSYAADILSELGYRVLTAADGPTALKRLKLGEGIDLLFTDVVLPNGMNGRQLAAEAEKFKPGLKVLFTTGYTRNAIVHNGRLDPGVEMIGKPFSFDELARSVRRILDEKRS